MALLPSTQTRQARLATPCVKRALALIRDHTDILKLNEKSSPDGKLLKFLIRCRRDPGRGGGCYEAVRERGRGQGGRYRREKFVTYHMVESGHVKDRPANPENGRRRD